MLPTMRAIPSSDRDVGGPNLFVTTVYYIGMAVGRGNFFRKKASSSVQVICILFSGVTR